MSKRKVVIITLATAILLVILVSSPGESTSACQLGAPVWRHETEDRIVATPLLYETRVYIQTLNEVMALDTTTGRMVWDTTIPSDAQYKTPMITDGETLFVGGDNGTLTAVSIEDGTILWSSQEFQDTSIEDIRAQSGIVYKANYNSSITAYDQEDGRILWARGVPSRSTLWTLSDEQNLYLGSHYNITAFDPKSGKTIWSHDLDGLVDYMVGSPNSIYVAYLGRSNEISIGALHLSNRKYEWFVEAEELDFRGPVTMILDDTNLYIAGNKLGALSIENGGVLWVNEQDFSYSLPVANQEKVYILSKNMLHVFDKITGSEVSISLPGGSQQFDWLLNQQIEPAITSKLLILTVNNRAFAYTLESLSRECEKIQ
jgi:outer membrane protein assembly factor BamB